MRPVKMGKKVHLIGYRSDGSSAIVSIRYPTADWTEAAARKHCAGVKGGTFHAAVKEEATSMTTLGPGLVYEDGIFYEMSDKARRMQAKQPKWSAVDKAALPDGAFAYVKKQEGKKPIRKYPYKWRRPDGRLEVHIVGLRAAWAMAHGARRAKGVSKAVPAGVIAKLKAEMKRYGIGQAGEDRAGEEMTEELATVLEEYLRGSFERKRDAISSALRDWHRAQFSDEEEARKHYIYILSTFDDHVVVQCSECGHKTWDIAYEIDADENVTIGELREVELTYVPKGTGARPQLPTGAAEGEGEMPAEDTSGEEPERPRVILEEAQCSERLEGDVVVFESGPLAAEADGDGGDPRAVYRGSVPMIKVDSVTENKRLYTETCVRRLQEDIEKIVEENGVGFYIGSMLPTHEPARRPDMQNILLHLSGGLTGLEYAEDTKIARILFETLGTTAGGDIAYLIRKTPFVKGVSLRALPYDKDVREDGVTVVNGMHLLGADFTPNPAMNYAPGDDTTFKAEEEADVKNLEELKQKHPEAYAALLDEAARILKEEDKDFKAGQAAVEELARVRLQGQIDAVMEAVREKAKADGATKGFSDNAQKAFLEALEPSVQAAVNKLIDEGGVEIGTERFTDRVMGRLEEDFKEQAKKYQAIVQEAQASALRRTQGRLAGTGLAEIIESGKAPKINVLPPNAIAIGEDRERVGLPTDSNRDFRKPTIKDKVLSEAFNIPMFMPDGRRYFDVFYPKQARYLRELNKVYEHRPFQVHEGAREQMTDAKYRAGVFGEQREWAEMVEKLLYMEEVGEAADAQMLMEAGEITSATALGTLLPDVRAAILEAIFAKSAWLNMATLEKANSITHRIYYEDSRRTTDHKFGSLAQGGSFSTSGDQGSLASLTIRGFGQRIWAKVTTQIAGATTLTVTYVDQNGITQTNGATATLADGEAVGTYIEIIPTIRGNRALDITGASASGWTAGAVDFVTEQPVVRGTASETAVSTKARTILTNVDVTMREFSIESYLTWELIEDAQRAMPQPGGGGWNAVARIVANMSKTVAQEVDTRGLGQMNLAANCGIADTFDVTTPDAGYTEKEWKAEIWTKIVQLMAGVEDRSNGLRPDILSINTADIVKMGWMDGFVKNPQRAGLPASDFFGALDVGQVAGMRVIASAAQNHNQFVAANSSHLFHVDYIPLEIRGPYGYVGSEKVDAYVIRQRSEDSFPRPATRGKLLITWTA